MGLFFFVFIFHYTTQAQGLNRHPFQQFQKEIDRAFGNLSSPNPWVMMMYEQGLHLTDTSVWNHFANDTINKNIWYLLYEEMYYCLYDSTAMEKVDSVMAKTVKYKDTVAFNFLDMYFNTFLDSTIMGDETYFDIDTINHVIYDDANRPSSPYLERNVFAVAPAINEALFGQVTFVYDPDLRYTDLLTNAQHLESGEFKIDFGDGNGWQNVNNASVKQYFNITYPDSGLYTLEVGYFENGQQLKSSKSNFAIQSPGSYDSYEPSFWQETDHLNIGVYTPCFLAGDNYLDNKFIIYLSGYNPSPLADLTNIKKRIANTFRTKILNTQIGLLRNHGYSIVIVDYKRNQGDIENNALYVAKYLKNLKCQVRDRGNKEQFVVIGSSMGGLIGRYALTFLENLNNYEPEDCYKTEIHNTRLFISNDQGMQGNHVPLSMQYLVNNPHIMFPNVGGLAAELLSIIEPLDKVAAKQQLVYHYSTENNNQYDAHPDFYAFRTKLKDLKPSTNGYPQYCKLAVYSAGLIDGSCQKTVFEDRCINPQQNLISGNTSINVKLFWSSEPIELSLQSFSLNLNPNGNGTIVDIKELIASIGIIFSSRCVLRLFGNCLIRLPMPSLQIIYNQTQEVVDVDNVLPYGSMTGGIISLGKESSAPGTSLVERRNNGDIRIDNFFARKILKADDYNFNESAAYKWCFSPVGSVIDYPNYRYMGYNFSYLNDYRGTLSRTPFDLILSQNLEGEHILHGDIINESYVATGAMENGLNSYVINREIGDDELYLENLYLKNRDVSFSSTDKIYIGQALNEEYYYPSYSNNIYGKPHNISKQATLGLEYSTATYYHDNTVNHTNNAYCFNCTQTVVDRPSSPCSEYIPVYVGAPGILGRGENISTTIEKSKSNLKSIYPNPISTSQTLYFEGITENFDIEILDIKGKAVFKANNVSPQLGVTLETNLQPGMYFVKLRNNNQTLLNSKLMVL